MSYGRFLITHPFSWAALAGVALGIAVATATRLSRKEANVHRARERKWAVATLWATAAVVFTACGFFVPEAREFLTYPSLYVAVGAAVFAAVALRFPRAGGIPAFLLVAVISLAGPLLMRPYVPIRGVGSAAELRVLATDESGLYVEVTAPKPSGNDVSAVTHVDGNPAVATAHTIQVSDYLFFLGARGGVVFESLVSADAAPERSVAAEPLDSMRLLNWVAHRLPLLNPGIARSQPVELKLLGEYVVSATADGQLQIMERTE